MRVALAHPRFRFVDKNIFVRRIVADCMTHACHIRDEGRHMPDACCQYGADVDVGERDRIMARADELKQILRPAARDAAWFTTNEVVDADFPSGRHVRTAKFGDGCVFLQHDARGCAIHRASIENNWDFRGVKPNICRLFPLSYDSESIVISDDYTDYSCAVLPDAPTLYRNGRDLLAELFGPELIAELDRHEQTSLRVIA